MSTTQERKTSKKGSASATPAVVVSRKEKRQTGTIRTTDAVVMTGARKSTRQLIPNQLTRSIKSYRIENKKLHGGRLNLIGQWLGGEKRLHLTEISSQFDFAHMIREGLPFESVDYLASHIQLDEHDRQTLLDVSRSTWMRRQKEPDKPMGKDTSDRAFRIAAIAALAEEVLGDEQKAVRWLHQPNRALGGSKPLDQLDTEVGVREVEGILERIAHGVYS